MQNSSWHISLLLSLPEADRQAWLESLSESEAQGLAYDWRFWARDKQVAPAGDWLVWLIRSGRGFGKTRTGAEWVIHRAQNGPFAPIALVGQSKADVRDTMIEIGESSIVKRSPPWFRPKYEPSKRRLTWPNGVVAIAYSGDEPDQLRGPQHGTAWVDELSKFRYAKETWDNLMFGLRVGDRPQVCVTTTPRPIQIIIDLVKDAKTVDVMGSSFENRANLSQAFFDVVLKPYLGTRLGRQEVEGEILSDVPGALWKLSQIEAARVKSVPELRRIVIGVDPPGSTAHCGIVVVGRDAREHGYVLADESIQGTPAEWAKAVMLAYHRWQADCIVAEVNQGGDMVEHTLRTVRDERDQQFGRYAKIKQVRATRGKLTRAEPVSAIYEQGRAHHVGAFADLETQMTTWISGESDSPDRMDALVWAFTELFPISESGTWGVV